MIVNTNYMDRCIELAKLGAGYTAPNPMVGAVLVHEERIIGEGWHRQYGQAHAEVNCIDSVAENDKGLIPHSTLYVSLEPCAHVGKTPACADLIIKNKIPRVVVGCADPFKEVDGKGMERMRLAGVEVVLADRMLQYACQELNRRFFTFHQQQRPYIILKWAQTGDGKIAPATAEGISAPASGRLFISNGYTDRLVHQWRSEEAAIMVGTNTALLDDPALTNRLWSGPSPIRLVIDRNGRLPKGLRLFDGKQPTIVFNGSQHTIPASMDVEQLKRQGGFWYYQLTRSAHSLNELLEALHQLSIQSVLVEGGAKLLQSFIDEKAWDEMRLITNEELLIKEGLDAPQPQNAVLSRSEKLFSDTIETYYSHQEY